jgi:diguanylate cyclase (GGDEF)-like protein
MVRSSDLAIAFSRKSVAVILAAVALAYVLAVAFVFDIARFHDQKSLVHTKHMVRLLIEEKENWISRTVVDYADWGAAYRHLHQSLDVAWAYDQDNVGQSLLKDLNIEYAAVFDPADTEVYSVVGGELQKQPAVVGIGGAADLIARARALGPREAATGILAAGGEPVLAAASVISSGADPSVQLDGRTPSVLLFGDRITKAELARMQESLDLTLLRLVPTNSRSGEQDVFLSSSDGRAGFALEVAAPKPGRDMVRAILPSFTAVGAVFAALLLWLGRLGLRNATNAHQATVALQESHRSLQYTAFYDSLTGLPNRGMFMLRLQEALSLGTPFAVIFLDLDRFKPINDTHGHDAGDFVLREIGARLCKTVRPEDLCARLGGDEFVIITSHLDASSLHQLCKSLLRDVSVEISYDGRPLSVGVSIGIARSRPGEDRVEDVLRRADQALYHAKTGGRSQYHWFNDNPGSERVSA